MSHTTLGGRYETKRHTHIKRGSIAAVSGKTRSLLEQHDEASHVGEPIDRGFRVGDETVLRSPPFLVSIHAINITGDHS